MAALDKPTHMAASLDLSGTANLLLDAGLARIESFVVIASGLTRLCREADLTTLKGIARVLLRSRPPGWLRAVVRDGRFVPELVPQQDYNAIAWLGEDLEDILLTAHQQVYGASDEHLRKLLGDAGELAILSALRRDGYSPRHVSLISDRFGYDIEHKVGFQTLALEIKAAVSSTATRVLISRNEFDVAKRMGVRWKLVQVTFSSRVIARGRATPDDVERIRELESHSLVEMAPAENERFRWTESAEIRPAEAEWKPSNLRVGDEFEASLSGEKV
ncbi:MAG: protein NO VEIN domain-containing protein [Gemmobacter sp.]